MAIPAWSLYGSADLLSGSLVRDNLSYLRMSCARRTLTRLVEAQASKACESAPVKQGAFAWARQGLKHADSVDNSGLNDVRTCRHECRTNDKRVPPRGTTQFSPGRSRRRSPRFAPLLRELGWAGGVLGGRYIKPQPLRGQHIRILIEPSKLRSRITPGDPQAGLIGILRLGWTKLKADG